MASTPQRRRIEIDALFVPMPQALITDTAVSAAACRLWGMIFTFGWNGTPPEFDALASALQAGWRSVYRWAQELQDAGWIDWDRNAPIGDRFTLRTSPHGDPIVNPDKTRRRKLSPATKELSPGSKELIVVTTELSQMTISGFGDPTPMPQIDLASSDQNHENHEIVVGVGIAKRESFFQELRRRKISRAKALEIVALNADPDTILSSIDNLYDPAEPKTMGGVIEQILDAPPPKGQPYERPESHAQGATRDHHRHAGGKRATQRRAAAASTDYDALLAEIAADNPDMPLRG